MSPEPWAFLMLGEPDARGTGTMCWPRAVGSAGGTDPLASVRLGRGGTAHRSCLTARPQPGGLWLCGCTGAARPWGLGVSIRSTWRKQASCPGLHLCLPEGLGGLLPSHPPQVPLSGCRSGCPPGIFPVHSSGSGQHGFTHGSLRGALEVTSPKAREGAAALVLPTDLRERRTSGAAAQP